MAVPGHSSAISASRTTGRAERSATGSGWARWPRIDRPAHPGLRSLVADHSAYTEATAPRHLVVPATAIVQMVIKIEDSPFRPPVFAAGVRDSYLRVEGDCAPSYIETHLSPLGAYALLGVPMNELSERIVDAVDLLGPAGRRLGEMVRAAPTWDRRFDLIDDFLLRRKDDGEDRRRHRPAPEVAWAWRRLVGTGGTAAIGRIAGDVGWSHKHLIAKFRQQVGLPPKSAARLIRFHRLLRRLDAHPPPAWRQVAAECGYADQAHLIRDFREFTGDVPTRFLAGAVASGRVTGEAG